MIPHRFIFLVQGAFLLFTSVAQAQLTIRSANDAEVIVSGRLGRNFWRADTLKLSAGKPVAVDVSKMGWILTIADIARRDKFEFVYEGPQQLVSLAVPFSESKVLNSRVNDSIDVFKKKLEEIHKYWDHAAQQQLAAIEAKDRKGFANWSDSLATADRQMGALAAALIRESPGSHVSQFAFGLYCFHMPEDSFFASYERLALANNLSLLPDRQLAEFSQRIDNRVGKPLPKVEFETIRGATIRPGLADGTVRVLYFTASFCGPCKKLKPELEKLSLYPQYRKVEFISISLEADEAGVAKALADVEKTPAAWQQVVMRSADNVQSNLSSGFPTLLVVDGQGTLKRRIIGYTDSTIALLKSELDSLL